MERQFIAPVVCLIALSAIFSGGRAYSHKDHHHGSPKAAGAALSKEVLVKINADYEQNVKPIFRKSCYDCHSQETRYPWYSSLPFAKGLIEKDVREAKEHLDLSNGFPFKGHGTPRTDLESIRDAVKNGSMPPLRYTALHWSAKLSKEEVATVLNWAETGLAALPTEPKK